MYYTSLINLCPVIDAVPCYFNAIITPGVIIEQSTLTCLHLFIKVFYIFRAKQNRLNLVKHQIETLLNIRGKEMPSVEEEFGSGNVDFSSLKRKLQSQDNGQTIVAENESKSRISDPFNVIASLYDHYLLFCLH